MVNPLSNLSFGNYLNVTVEEKSLGRKMQSNAQFGKSNFLFDCAPPGQRQRRNDAAGSLLLLKLRQEIAGVK